MTTLTAYLTSYAVGLEERAAELAPRVNGNGESGEALSLRHMEALRAVRALADGIKAVAPHPRDHQTAADPARSYADARVLYVTMLRLNDTLEHALKGLVTGLADQGYYDGAKH